MPEGPVNHDVVGMCFHWRSPRLAAMPGVVHGFTGRRGGGSGAMRELNLAPRPWDAAEAVRANWHRVAGELGVPPERLALVHQVHGRTVCEADAATVSGPAGVLGEADAVFTRASGVAVAVRTADCVPILLAAPEGPVAAVHAGWRGAAAGVVRATVEALAEAGVAPAALVAAIGPSIAGAHYEVGAEVVEALAATGVPAERFVTGRSERGRPCVAVAAAVEAQLRALGVEQIDRYEGSTWAEPDLWSHRRDGPRAGRQAAVIARRP